MSGKSKSPSRKTVDVDPVVAAANAKRQQERMEALKKKEEDRFVTVSQFVDKHSVPSSAYKVIAATVKTANKSLENAHIDLKTSITEQEIRFKDHANASAALAIAYKKQLRTMLNSIKQAINKTKAVASILETDEHELFDEESDDQEKLTQ